MPRVAELVREQRARLNAHLREEISRLEAEIAQIKAKLAVLEGRGRALALIPTAPAKEDAK